MLSLFLSPHLYLCPAPQFAQLRRSPSGQNRNYMKQRLCSRYGSMGEKKALIRPCLDLHMWMFSTHKTQPSFSKCPSSLTRGNLLVMSLDRSWGTDVMRVRLVGKGRLGGWVISAVIHMTVWIHGFKAQYCTVMRGSLLFSPAVSSS